MKRLAATLVTTTMVVTLGSACTSNPKTSAPPTPVPSAGVTSSPGHAATPNEQLVLDWRHHVVGPKVFRAHPAQPPADPNAAPPQTITSPPLGRVWGIVYSGECRPDEGDFRLEEVKPDGKVIPLIGPALHNGLTSNNQIVARTGLDGHRHHFNIYGVCSYTIFFISEHNAPPGQVIAKFTHRGPRTVSFNNPSETWVLYWGFRCPSGSTTFRIVHTLPRPQTQILKLRGRAATGQADAESAGPQSFQVDIASRCAWTLRFID
jgi:hypothetical protein